MPSEPKPDSWYEGPDIMGQTLTPVVIYRGNSGRFWWAVTEVDGEILDPIHGPFHTARAAWCDALGALT